jgi:hypothetical protein
MKFNKILDVTESDSPFVQTGCERENNQMLQYDDSDLTLHDDYDNDGYEEEIEDDDRSEQDFQEHLERDLAIIHPESAGMMDDWKCAEIKVDEIVSDQSEQRQYDLSHGDSDSSIDSFFKPEADQNVQLISDDALAAIRHNYDFTTITRVHVDE